MANIFSFADHMVSGTSPQLLLEVKVTVDSMYSNGCGRVL